MSQQVLLITHHHFDPTWRRCFDRDAEFNGVIVRSYAEIEEHVIDAWLSLADRGWTFCEGQAVVWRKYLQRNPHRLGEIRKRIAEGNCAVMFAGETVQDTNLPTAEGLVRNYLVSLPLYRTLVGDDYPGMKVGWQEDAFGNSPNYPQVLKGVGIEYAARLSYRTVQEGDVWVGIDGTKIPQDRNVPEIFTGGFEKHPPCPVCKGRGCDTCAKSGIVPIPFDTAAVRAALMTAIEAEEPTTVVYLMAEELIPNVEICDMVDKLNIDHSGKSKIEYGTYLDELALYHKQFADAMTTQSDTPTGDLNPAMPGCMVTRIKIKQRLREVSYKLIRAEAQIAAAGWNTGYPAPLPSAFEKVWQDIAFVQFHDAVTGTHVDNAYVELMDMLESAEKVADAHLQGENVPIEVDRQWQTDDSDSISSIEFGRLNVQFDKAGIISIGLQDNLFGEYGALRTRRPLRIGELTIEEDFGDAWGQRSSPFTGVTSNMGRILLGAHHAKVEVAHDGIRWHGAYKGGDPRIARLAWTTTATISKDGQRLDFVTAVDWDTHSRRLRVIVPVASTETSATYEVPFGCVDRVFDEAEVGFSQWKADHREFPTLHWGRKAIDDSRGVAILNKGLPCYRWLPGAWDVSLLRSPEAAFCANENGNYEFADIDGQRDAGKHRFEYSIWPYAHGLSAGDLTRAGYAYNDASPAVPFEATGDVVVTAFKPAEDGSGWILRLQDASGTGTVVSIDFGREVGVCAADLLERPLEVCSRTQCWSGPIHRHGILTLAIAP